MNNNFSESDVNVIGQVTKELFFKYTNEPYYLKETLREIRSLVHQADLQADKLIIEDWFKDFDPKDTIDTLTKEFPNLKWEEDICEDNYEAEGTLCKLVVKVSYKIRFADSVFRPSKKVEPYWELDIYLNHNDSCIGMYNPTITKFNTLSEVITVAKQNLRPLCNLFSNLEI